jgi:ribosomal protein S18 acetylase RimI-like enzyme
MSGEVVKVCAAQSQKLLDFLCQLDTESEYMLYRPGERRANGHDLRGHIRCLRSNSVIFAYHIPEVGFVSYLALYGGRQARDSHVATLSCGTLKAWRCQGFMSALWGSAKAFAVEHGLCRIELTVVMQNVEAVQMYAGWGFEFEGVRRASWSQTGTKNDLFQNEWWMAWGV